MAGIPKELREYRRSVIAARYEQEGSVPIARDLGLTRGAVLNMAKRMGLVYKDRYKHHGDKVRAAAAREGNGFERRIQENKTCNTHYFDEWSPQMAYVLGFLFADGSVSTYSLVADVTRSDEQILHFIRHELGLITPIRHYIATNPSTKPYARLVVNSKRVVRQLNRLGMKSGKTYLDEPFPEVPEDCLRDFIRGYFDGDGSVNLFQEGSCSAGFIGTPKFVTSLRDLLVARAEMGQIKVTLRKGKRAIWGQVYWYRASDLRRFYDFLYPSGFVFCLNRKRKRLQEWLSRSRKVSGKRI